MSAITEMMSFFASIASRAGEVVMEARDDVVSRVKADGSPVTEADERAEDLIVGEVARHLPDCLVIGEEMVARNRIDPNQSARRVILVDALDGTREYVRGSEHFTVNIALIEGDRVVLGCVYAPALGEMFTGGAGLGCHVAEGLAPGADPGRIAPAPISGLADRSGPPMALVSRSHLDPRTRAFLHEHRIAIADRIGSSLKLCRLAQDAADVYPRFGPTMEWDIAAGQAVVEGAGGIVATPDGRMLTYGKPGRRNGAFQAWSATGQSRHLPVIGRATGSA